MTIFLASKIFGGAAYVALEYWLGKTAKTRAGSVLELVLNGLNKVANPEPKK